MNKRFKLFGGVAALLVAGAVLAQTFSVPLITTLAPSADVVQVLPSAIPTAQNKYVVSGLVAGAPLYQNLGVITTGNTYTFTHGVQRMFAQPAGTLAAVTLTTEASPNDGQIECFTSGQTTTSLTWNANTGQTINSSAGISAGVANTAICLQYSVAAASWFRI
jgi:hypothetical protein